MRKTTVDYKRLEELASQGLQLKSAAPLIRMAYPTMLLRYRSDKDFRDVWERGVCKYKEALGVSGKVPFKKFGDPEYEEIVSAKRVKTLMAEVKRVIGEGEILFYRIARSLAISPDDLGDILLYLKLEKKIVEVEKGAFTVYFLAGSEPHGSWSVVDGRVSFK